jgi:hypothetical protein
MKLEIPITLGLVLSAIYTAFAVLTDNHLYIG